MSCSFVVCPALQEYQLMDDLYQLFVHFGYQIYLVINQIGIEFGLEVELRANRQYYDPH